MDFSAFLAFRDAAASGLVAAAGSGAALSALGCVVLFSPPPQPKVNNSIHFNIVLDDTQIEGCIKRRSLKVAVLFPFWTLPLS
tara:strand:- start:38 stop:286 length:249 start_codon:yes stop_codon:yes gene_type:complete